MLMFIMISGDGDSGIFEFMMHIIPSKKGECFKMIWTRFFWCEKIMDDPRKIQASSI